MWTWREKSHSARITDKKEVKVMGVGVGAGMDEEEASWCVISIAGCLRDKHWGAPGCGGDVRLCHSQTCGMCVWRVAWGCVRERERQRRETGGLRWSSSMGQKREGNEGTSLGVQWLGCCTFTEGVKVGS